MKHFLEENYKILIGIILAFMLTVSLLNAWWDGAIFDETAHIPAGYSYVKEHDMRLNPEHPPLLKDLAGLMLLPMHPRLDTGKAFWTTDINGQWDAGRDLLWQEGNNADWLIFWSRVPFVILSIILGLFIFKWVRELAGITAGLLALVLYAFDPNILGHNHFVTTDLGIAAFMTFSFYYFLQFIKQPSWKNVVLGGVFLGLVQLVKFSSIMLFPIYGLVLIAYPLVRLKRNFKESNLKFKLKKTSEYLGKGALAFAISLIVVWGVYALNTYKMPEQKLADTIEYYFPHNDVSKNAVITNKVALALNENALTRPFSEYFLGIAMVFKRVEGGNGAYFMGQVSGKAFPAYFPTVFAIKEPLPSLFLMFAAFLISISTNLKALVNWTRENLRKKINSFSAFVRHNITGISLSAFVVLYAYISITGNLNIGFRHLFPILPFLYILTSKTILGFMRKIDQEARLIWGIMLIAVSTLLISGTAAAYPAYMSYFNEAAGGSQNGYKYVTDSNADWGQDIKRLKVWVTKYNWCDGSNDQFCKIYNPEKGPIEKLRINYFGGGDIKYYFGDQAIDWWDSKRPLEPGWYAISTNYLQGSIYDNTKKDSESYRWIKNIKPVAQVGTSIFVYYITSEDIAGIK